MAVDPTFTIPGRALACRTVPESRVLPVGHGLSNYHQPRVDILANRENNATAFDRLMMALRSLAKKPHPPRLESVSMRLFVLMAYVSESEPGCIRIFCGSRALGTP